ncbi:MAG: hypothetical protein EON98_08320 [Chitinophagaceae bacterium]|nr:MAG: hypothetical protein EON98_08320 [Chitinophagaceae bacterium]
MKRILIIASVVMLVAGCRFGNKGNQTVDGMRIVSLSKHLTEMMYALGEGHRLVAVDLSSTYPDSAKFLNTVGYHRALNPEGIIAMNPDLVIHSNDKVFTKGTWTIF